MTVCMPSQALNPMYIYKFFNEWGVSAWRMLGAVMLSVTGCEAMFADLGHFDVTSIAVSSRNPAPDA